MSLAEDDAEFLSISRLLVTNMGATPPREAPKQANSPKIRHFGSFSMGRLKVSGGDSLV